MLKTTRAIFKEWLVRFDEVYSHLEKRSAQNFQSLAKAATVLERSRKTVVVKHPAS
jgi:hypothetical protein